MQGVTNNLSIREQAKNWIQNNSQYLGITTVALVALGFGLMIAGGAMNPGDQSPFRAMATHLFASGALIVLGTIFILGILEAIAFDRKKIKPAIDFFELFGPKKGDYSKIVGLAGVALAALGLGFFIGGCVMQSTHTFQDASFGFKLSGALAFTILGTVGGLAFQEDKKKPIEIELQNVVGETCK